MLYSKWYLVWAYFCLFILGLVDNSRGPIYSDILNDFNVSTSQGAGVFAYASMFAVVVAFSSRWWLPFLGVVRALRVLLLCQIVAILLFGYSLTMGSFVVILISSSLLGISFGGIGVCLNILIVKLVKRSFRKRAFSGLHACYGISSLIAPMILAGSLSLGFHWDQYFKWLAIFPTFALIISCSLRSLPTGNIKNFPTINWIIRIKFGLIFAFYVMAELSISTRLVYFVNELGYKNGRNYLMLFFLFLLLGRLFFAIITIPVSAYRLMIISFISSFICYILGLTGHPIFLSLCGLTMSYFFPCALDWLSEKFHESKIEYITSSVMTTIGIGLMGMHFVIGYLANIYGIKGALFLGPLLLFFGLICLITYGKKIPSI